MLQRKPRKNYIQQGFVAQLVEHRTSIMEVMGSNPIEASEFFLGFVLKLQRSLSFVFFIHSSYIWFMSYKHHVILFI